MSYLGLDPNTPLLNTSTQTFSGTGADLQFTLARSIASASDIDVMIGSTLQRPFADYTANNTTLLFVNAPTSGTDNITVTYRAGALNSLDLSVSVFQAGTVGAPGVVSVAANNTGFYWANATTLIATVGGANRVTFNGLAASSSNTSGALTVQGGIGVSGNINNSGLIKTTNTTESFAVTSGALQVAGGAGIVGNLNVGGDITCVGDFTVNGTFTTTGTDSLEVTDPFIFLANANPGDSFDTGVVSQYNDGVTTRYTGYFRDITDAKYKLFGNLTVKPTTTVDTLDPSFQYDDLILANLSATGNIQGTYLIGNGYFLSGVVSDTTQIVNSGSKVIIPSPNGNIVANVAATTVTTTYNGGFNVVGQISTTGNVLTPLTATMSTGNITAGSTIEATGNISSLANIAGANILTGGIASAFGNVTGGNITTGGRVDAGGNIQGGNLRTLGLISAAGDVFANNISLNNTVVATGNITGGNINADADVVAVGAVVAGTTISAAGNITGSNLITTGNITTTANVIASNVVISGNIFDTNALQINAATGNITLNPAAGSNVQITSNAKVTISTPSTSTTSGAIVTPGGVGVGGNVWIGGLTSVGGNITGANLITAGLATVTGNITGGNLITGGLITATGNITGGNISTSGSGGNITGANNITATNFNGTTFSATGNITGGNIITGGALSTTGAISATANVIGGNLVTAGAVSAGGIVSATGNITGGNISTAGLITSTGNITSTANVAGGNVLSTLLVQGSILSATANIFSSANVTATDAFLGARLSLSGNVISQIATTSNIAGGNLNTFGQVSAVGNLTTDIANVNAGNAIVSMLVQGMVLSASGNVVGGNITTIGLISATGNITGGNIITGGAVSATGAISATANVTGANLVTGGNVYAPAIVNNGAYNTKIELGAASGIIAVTTDGNSTQFGPSGTITLGGASQIQGGTFGGSGITLAGTQTDIFQNRGGNVTVQVGTGGTIASTWTFTNSGDLNAPGAVSAVGNVTGGNIVTGGLISATGNIDGGNLSGTSIVGTLTTASQTNITSVGTLGSLAVTANISGGNLLTGGLISATGSITGASLNITTGTANVGNITNANGNGIGNIGNSTVYFNTVFAKATSAQYADLAENYLADAEYPPGTVVSFGGTHEVTVSHYDNDKRVAGVVSTNPSYIMNSGLEGEHVVIVALTGRVPTRVLGPVRKGDMMVSAGYGLARSESAPEVGAVIGKALADFTGTEGVIEVVVGKN